MSTRPLARQRWFVSGFVLFSLVAVGLVAPVSATAQTRTARYIVTTWTGQGAARTVAELGRFGTRPRHRFDRVFPGFAADLSSKQVAALRDSNQVRSIAPDRVLRISTTQASAPWGLDRLDLRTAPDGSYSYPTTGSGVTAYVIDTGVRAQHQEFGGRARSGWDFVDQDANADDCNGHGTHVAGTVAGRTYGVAKAASVVSLRVLDCEGSGYESDFISAMQWVINHHSGPAVVNISAGGDLSPQIDAAVESVVADRVPVVVAAGNEDQDACRVSPARARNALTVGAIDRFDQRAGYSNYGSCVDIFAPGSLITSAGFSSDTATQVMSGTSMATPHVTGAVARYLQAYPNANPAMVRSAMLSAATSNGVSDPAGSPNKLLYLHPWVAGAPPNTVVTRSDQTSSAKLAWTPPYGFGAPNVTGYRVTRTAGRATVSADLAVGARSYVFTGLARGATYTLTVRALGSTGAGSSATRAVTMLTVPGQGHVSPPAAGSTSDSATSITARWRNPSPGGPIASYAIEARRVGTSTTTKAAAARSSRTQQISTLTRNAPYEVRVRAVNAAGPGSWSTWSGRATAR